MSYRQFWFVKSASTSHKNVISDMKGPERGKRVKVAATECWEAEAAKRLQTEQKANTLLRKLVPRLSQPGNLFVDLCAGTLSITMACFTVPCHRVVAGHEASLACFSVAEETTLRPFAKSALDAEMDVELSEKAAGTAARVSSLALKVASADLLWFQPDSLPL